MSRDERSNMNDYSELVKALRWCAENNDFVFANEHMLQAADAIEALTTENAELREANEMLKVEIGLTDKNYTGLRNFACQLCGKYKTAHEGSCDGCRWRKEQ